jgi:hypothetical protein
MKIQLPKVWNDLLAGGMPHDAEKATITYNDDPTFYRDDSREVKVQEGDIVVSAKLSSGQTNYWLEWEIFIDGEWHSFDDVDYEVKAGPMEFYPCGSKTVQFDVELV